jgi:hypothetical protein
MKLHNPARLPFNEYNTLLCKLIRLTKHTLVIQPIMKGHQQQIKIKRPSRWKNIVKGQILDLIYRDGAVILNRTIARSR